MARPALAGANRVPPGMSVRLDEAESGGLRQAADLRHPHAVGIGEELLDDQEAAGPQDPVERAQASRLVGHLAKHRGEKGGVVRSSHVPAIAVLLCVACPLRCAFTRRPVARRAAGG